jgi:hypothetical protein
MNDRVSRIVLLCEDQRHQQLVFAYLHRCGCKNPERIVRPRVASREKHGGNVGWVLDEFPKELEACRKRQTRVNTLLIVFVDADTLTVEARRRQFRDRLKAMKHKSLTEKDPVVLLIAKYHVETWICALLGQSVSEEEDCKKRKFTKEEIHQAAKTLHAWSRENAAPQSSHVPSLMSALPGWRMISDSL